MINPLDLIFPKYCYSCGKKLQNTYICNDCLKDMNGYLDKNICPICGTRIQNNRCNVCSVSDFSFDIARSVFSFNNTIKNLIHNFKYADLPKIGKILSEYAVDYLKKNNIFLDTDYILPVPLHKVKKRTRGFNQSEIIAKGIAIKLNFKPVNNLITRKKFTETQTKLSRKEREQNVGSAFKLNKKYNVAGKNILIVDDVFTTGSTVNSISKILRLNNAEKIFVLTIARAE